MYRIEWMEEKKIGIRQKEYIGCFGIHRTTHWRWVNGKLIGRGNSRMRIKSAIVDRVREMDEQYRYTWDTRAIAHVTGISHGSVAKILNKYRLPKQKKMELSHNRRTKIKRSDVMWSSDFTEIADGKKLLKTIDEKSDYRVGWEVSESEDMDTLLRHAEEIISRTGRRPLVWKYDNGPCFKSVGFKQFLKRHDIVPYPIQGRAPWTNGRSERDHREIQNWLAFVDVGNLNDEGLKKDINEGMHMLNHIKPRAVLEYKTSAEVYYEDEGVAGIDRKLFMEEVARNRAKEVNSNHSYRRAVRTTLQNMGLYEEWLNNKFENRCVNRSRSNYVAF